MSRNNKSSMPSIHRQTLESSSSSLTTNQTISSRSPSPQSPASSCISSESYSSSPEKMAPMVLAGCARCMMYVMLSEEDPKCPKCKNPVLIDFSHGKISKNKNKNKTN